MHGQSYSAAGGGSKINHYRKVTSAPTIADDDVTLECDMTAAGFDVVLPDPTSAGRILNVLRSDATANTGSILPHAAETISGAASLALAVPWQTYTLQSTGTNWILI